MAEFGCTEQDVLQIKAFLLSCNRIYITNKYVRKQLNINQQRVCRAIMVLEQQKILTVYRPKRYKIDRTVLETIK